jgi:hypothetical protein
MTIFWIKELGELLRYLHRYLRNCENAILKNKNRALSKSLNYPLLIQSLITDMNTIQCNE